MKYNTKHSWQHIIGVRLHLMVVVSWLGLALLGQLPESRGGWLSCPPQGVVVRGHATGRRPRRLRPAARPGGCGRDWGWVAQTGRVALGRSLGLGLLWWLSGEPEPSWLVGLPGLVWLWQSGGRLWPGLVGQPEWRLGGWLVWQGQRLAWLAYLGLLGSQVLHGDLVRLEQGLTSGLGLGLLGCVRCGRSEPWVNVEHQADGSYQAELCGHFSLSVAGDEPFRLRLLMVFLRLLEVEGQERHIGRTRDDRAPFVRQVHLAAWFGVPQSNLSRWERYWLEGNWPDLLSLINPTVLTPDVRAAVVQVLGTFPWWGPTQVQHYLQQHGQPISLPQVKQVAQESGFNQFRQTLSQRYHLSATNFRPRDEWLVGQLLAQVESLLTCLETGTSLPAHSQVSLRELQRLATELEVTPPPPLKALPWLVRLEQLVWGQWQAIADEPVRCIYCGSDQVVRKSQQPRWKQYYDAHGQLQRLAVYRYYCRNPHCAKGSFTNLPPGLSPYSRYRTELKLLALQMYAWGYSTYRRTGQALGVKSMTVYRWVSAWGDDLLPVAALFGLVKSSGVVGIDEKYVLVPKNDKPPDPMRRWMYVYLAVDVYTYDLLHLAIYPNNDQDTALTFLLALRAKGYQPRVVVTDLRRDYGPELARVFPQAVHHECLFHALHHINQTCRSLYGRDFAHTHPHVEQLRHEIGHIFQAKTKRTAQKRYERLMAKRAPFLQAQPEAAPLFDFWQRHWPKLVNAFDSDLIPKTNNAVELVIRRFDQHYQAFCGFENIETAQRYLAVFEKLYRFTPFSDDAQPAIRGKSPLQLAGYDLSQLPFTALCQGLSLDWPMEVAHHDVPK